MTLAPVLRALDTDGFAVVRGALTAGEMARVAAAFDRLEAQARRIAAGEPEPEGASFVLDPDPFRLHRVVWAGGADADLAALGAHPAFLRLAAASLGSPEVVQIIQQAHFKLPGDEVAFGWHQDASNRRYGTPLWDDRDGQGTYVQIGLAVDPMTLENGPLRMVRGSHRLGFVADPETGEIPGLPDLPIDDVLLEPGDLAVFGPFVIHGSGPNRSSVPRRLFLQGYTLPGVNHRVYPGCGTGVVHRVAA
ncbi:MAG: phytanoyl-CoA dioxygenase family protein [Alphaproteobacteria bacterium]|nr:phytanoyl-CoA dioxygenase family protein [Alphaproteobacteria bacterium]